jgi:hypothetical protein
MIRAAWFLLALCVAGGALAQPNPQAAPKPAPQASKAPAKAPRPTRPAWAELTAEQQLVLSPLKPDWDSLDTVRKRKWIGIAKRYPKMAPQLQERVEKRMQDWARLTPEQRQLARESYKSIAKSPPDRRANLREQWAHYQSLSPSERQNLIPPSKPAPKKKKP